VREPRRFLANLLLGFLAGAPFRFGTRLGLLAREPFAVHALVGVAREPRSLLGVLLLGGFTGLALGISARLGLLAGAALCVCLLFRLLACLALDLLVLLPLGQLADACGVCLGHVPLGFGAEPSFGLGLFAHPRLDFARQALRFRARQALRFESPFGFLSQLAFRLLARPPFRGHFFFRALGDLAGLALQIFLRLRRHLGSGVLCALLRRSRLGQRTLDFLAVRPEPIDVGLQFQQRLGICRARRIGLAALPADVRPRARARRLERLCEQRRQVEVLRDREDVARRV